MNITFETEREIDGRWIAEVPELLGVMAYGQTERQAIGNAEALALRALAERIENDEASPISTSAPDGCLERHLSRSVTPAKAGGQLFLAVVAVASGIPACAGMTDVGE